MQQTPAESSRFLIRVPAWPSYVITRPSSPIIKIHYLRALEPRAPFWVLPCSVNRSSQHVPRSPNQRVVGLFSNSEVSLSNSKINRQFWVENNRFPLNCAYTKTIQFHFCLNYLRWLWNIFEWAYRIICVISYKFSEKRYRVIEIGIRLLWWL